MVDNNDTPAQGFEVPGIVRCQKHADVFEPGHLSDRIPDVLLGDHVQADGRLVEQDQLRSVEQRGGNLTAHPLTEGQFPHGSLQQVPDLEALCRRVIIINHGQIVYEDKVSNLKRKFLTSKLVEVRYAEEVPSDFSLDGVEILKVGHYGVKLRFDTRKTSVERVLSHLTGSGSVVDITISDPPLEEVIARIYQTQDTTLQ